MTPFRSMWLALLWLLRCLEVNLLPLGINSIQATFWASMNLGHLIDSNRLLSPLFKRWLLRLIRLFEEQPFHQRTKSGEHNQRAEVTALIKHCCQEFNALAKTQRAAFFWGCRHIVSRRGCTGMTKRSGQNEHITPTPDGMCGMAMPQLVRM